MVEASARCSRSGRFGFAEVWQACKRGEVLGRCLRRGARTIPLLGAGGSIALALHLGRLAQPGPAACEAVVAAPALEAAVAVQPRARFGWWRVVLRAIMLFWRATPVLSALPLCWLLWRRGGESVFWKLALSALQAHGPLSVKFAQWASTRPDLLPADVCAHLALLQDAVRPHPFSGTVKTLEEAFGPEWAESLQVEKEPVGSGCMAQVYKGRLVTEGESREVALKVRHPNAQTMVDLDLSVLWGLVGAFEALAPAMAKYLAMSEALSHFEAFVRPQSDLRIEARNLERFRGNFPYADTGKGLRVRFPSVIRPYVSEAVIVETFEEAVPLQAVLNQRSTDGTLAGMGQRMGVGAGQLTLDDVRCRVGKLCMDMFMQMLFKDNFIHGDCHPGNIHFRFLPPAAPGKPPEPEIVLFDAGLAVELSGTDRRNFIEVFHSIAMKDGNRAATLMVERSPGDRSQVVDEAGFVKKVGNLINGLRDNGIALGKVRLGDTFSELIGLSCWHRVKLETAFVTVCTSIIVIEGVGRQLNPVVDIIMAARPLLVEAFVGKLW